MVQSETMGLKVNMQLCLTFNR